MCPQVRQAGGQCALATLLCACVRAEASVCRRVTNGSHSGAGTELHCDLAGLVAGPKFRGIKMLPPGLHLVCWDAGQDKHAAFLLFPSGHVETWRWDPLQEDLEPICDTDERERLVYAVRSSSLDRELGQYPDEANAGWPRLTYLVTPATLQRMGLSGGVKTSSSAQQTVFDRDRIADAPVAPVFSPLAEARRGDGMTPAEVTKYNLDGTQRLRETLTRSALSWRELLAEVQMAFILFLVGASLPALEFWKRACALLCSCGDGFAGPGDAGARVHLELMSEFVRVLRRQLEHVPADFFRDELAKASFLGPALASLLQVGDAAEAQMRQQHGGVCAQAQAQAHRLAAPPPPKLPGGVDGAVVGQGASDADTREEKVKEKNMHQSVSVGGGSDQAVSVNAGGRAAGGGGGDGLGDRGGDGSAAARVLRRRLLRLKSVLATRFEMRAEDLSSDLLAQEDEGPVVVALSDLALSAAARAGGEPSSFSGFGGKDPCRSDLAASERRDSEAAGGGPGQGDVRDVRAVTEEAAAAAGSAVPPSPARMAWMLEPPPGLAPASSGP